MDAKKCDRCKKYYDEYVGVYKYGENGSVYQKYKLPYNQLFVNNAIHNTVSNKRFDLCPDCMMEFDKWINMKGE